MKKLNLKKIKLRKLNLKKLNLKKLRLKKINLKNKKKLALIIVPIISILLLIGITYSRYIYNAINERYLLTKKFYFNSDKLDINRPIYQIENWSAVDEYSILVDLNSYLNNYEVCPYDIDYELSYTCSSNVNCSISKTSGVVLSSSNHDSFQAVISPIGTLNEGDSAFIEIKAKSNSPYKKEISARFILNVGYSKISYAIDDSVNSPYLNFNITNTLDYYLVTTPFSTYSIDDKLSVSEYLSLTDTEKNNCKSALVTLSFDPTIVSLDMTSSAYLKKESETYTTIDGNNYVNSITFKVDAISSEVVKFYKSDTTNDYTYPITNSTSIISFTSS